MENFLIELIVEKAGNNNQWVRVEMATDDFYKGQVFEGRVTDIGENHLMLVSVKLAPEVCFYRSIKHIELIESKPLPLMHVLRDPVEGYIKRDGVEANLN